MKTIVYSLTDPVTGELRYVGKTRRSLRQRLTQHMYICSKRRNRNYNWLLSLKRRGLEPHIRELEVYEGEDWREGEVAWITRLRLEGADLLNAADGGQGPSGIKRPDLKEVNRIRFTGRKLTAEHKDKIRKSGIGRTKSEEAKEKTAAFHRGRKRSEETRKLMSEARVAQGLTKAREEQLKRLHEKNTGVKRSEEIRRKISEAVHLASVERKRRNLTRGSSPTTACN